MSPAYHLIVLFLTVLVGRQVIKEASFGKKAGAAIVLILLALRLFLIR